MLLGGSNDHGGRGGGTSHGVRARHMRVCCAAVVAWRCVVRCCRLAGHHVLLVVVAGHAQARGGGESAATADGDGVASECGAVVSASEDLLGQRGGGGGVEAVVRAANGANGATPRCNAF
jgi:hypothetical protein